MSGIVDTWVERLAGKVEPIGEMTHWQRLEAAFNRQRTDFVPVAPELDYWQITYAGPSLQKMVDRYVELFDLGGDFTNIYTNDHFGYEGGITWFDARDGGLLDSLEYLEPNDPAKAVARFVRRNGSGIYMASIETDDIPEIRQRVTSTGDGWQGADFGGFIHPSRLHGLLLGLVTYERWNATRPLPDSS